MVAGIIEERHLFFSLEYEADMNENFDRVGGDDGAAIVAGGESVGGGDVRELMSCVLEGGGEVAAEVVAACGGDAATDCVVAVSRGEDGLCQQGVIGNAIVEESAAVEIGSEVEDSGEGVKPVTGGETGKGVARPRRARKEPGDLAAADVGAVAPVASVAGTEAVAPRVKGKGGARARRARKEPERVLADLAEGADAAVCDGGSSVQGSVAEAVPILAAAAADVAQEIVQGVVAASADEPVSLCEMGKSGKSKRPRKRSSRVAAAKSVAAPRKKGSQKGGDAATQSVAASSSEGGSDASKDAGKVDRLIRSIRKKSAELEKSRKKSVAAILDIAREMVQLRDSVDHGGWGDALENVSYQKRHANRYVAIGRGEWADESVVASRGYINKLPADVHKLASLAKLSVAQLDLLISRGDVLSWSREEIGRAVKQLKDPSGEKLSGDSQREGAVRAVRSVKDGFGRILRAFEKCDDPGRETVRAEILKQLEVLIAKVQQRAA